jgi:dienelactone hydrolase
VGETIKLKSADGFNLSAYVAGPATAAKGVVVVQEIFGVNHHIRDMADRFAALGYRVVALLCSIVPNQTWSSATRRTISPRAATTG